jgi:hypothetical protein
VLKANGDVLNVPWDGVEQGNAQLCHKILRSAGVVELLWLLFWTVQHPCLLSRSGPRLWPAPETRALNGSICHQHPVLRKMNKWRIC